MHTLQKENMMNPQPFYRKTATMNRLVLYPAALALVLVGCLTSVGRAATIDAGSNPTFSFDYLVDSDAKADEIVSTDSTSGLAFSNTADDGDSATPPVTSRFNGSSTGFAFPGSRNVTYPGGTAAVAYHFKPDDGFQITAASVTSSIITVSRSSVTANDFDTVTALWSTTGDEGDWTQFAQVNNGGGTNGSTSTTRSDYSAHDLADTGFTGGTELYLKYELTPVTGSTQPQRTEIFRSNDGSYGFHANLDIAPVPEPASAAVFAAGLCGVLLSRRRAR